MPKVLAFIVLLLAATSLQGCARVFEKSSKEVTEAYYETEPAFSHKWIKVVLNNSFIEKYKNRASMAIDMTVDEANKAPKPAFTDGDFHIAGRSPEVGLPVVAEITNSAHEAKAIRLVHKLEKKNITVPVAGVWRIWFEHPGGADETQGAALKMLRTENPDHVFEIHPVTSFGQIDTRDSMHPVKNYMPGSAGLAFKTYRDLKIKIIPGKKTTTIMAHRAPFNDVEFVMEIKRKETAPDGRFMISDALNLKGNLLASNIRMVFMKGTPPEQIARELKPGARLHVFAIPRINFDALCEMAKTPGPEERALPYEMIIIGVYEDTK